MTDNSNVTTRTAQSPNGSTLIEFPGVNRPAWRRELSERFREIQQRRARETDSDGEEPPRRAPSAQTFSAPEETPAARRAAESASKQLGLVPQRDAPEPNPIVAAALARIARARASAQAQPVARHGSGRAQAAAARVVEEQAEELAEAVAPTPQPTPLVVVQPKQAPKPEPTPPGPEPEPAAGRVEAEEPEAPARKPSARAAATEEAAVPAAEPVRKSDERVRKSEVARAKAEVAPHASRAPSQTAAAVEQQADSRQPRHIDGVLDEFWLERQGIELLPKVAEKELTYDDRAPRVKRLAAASADLLVVALLAVPFAAAIELTISNWGDQRVWGSMALIAGLVMFLYHTCSVALAGRTLGMGLFGLQAVDAHKASVPTTGQCMRRAFVYMLSLATAGLGILYSLFDAEGRTAHDILSGTVVVRK
ncbi:MAG TPA: RDD family protein [Pyrinomonadaceae bacterium]|jgi:uncharacterized RDD family membrane protein YckC